MANESGSHSQSFTIYLVKLVKDNDCGARRLAAQLNGMSYRAKDKDVCVHACVFIQGYERGWRGSREAIVHVAVCNSPLTALSNFWETCWLTAEATDPSCHWHLLITDLFLW